MTEAQAESYPITRTVLNAGSGPRGRGIHACFQAAEWTEVRFDLDPEVQPDVVGSIVDMHPHFNDATFDAVWSSHNIEHLYEHEVTTALAEFHRVLKPDGFAVITCPDLEAVAEILLTYGLDAKAYDAAIGPIRVHDILFGHGGSIAAGNHFMAHRTGFTQERLGLKAIEAGFSDVRVGRGSDFDLWAVLPMPSCDGRTLRNVLSTTNIAFLMETQA